MSRRTPQPTETPEATAERLGAAILASDRSVQAITEIMRGVGYPMFHRMDRRDNWGGVPAWHPFLRRWRNSCRFTRVLADQGGAA